MLQIKPNCKICMAIQQNKKLMERIYQSSYFIPHSKDSLLKIWKDCEGMFSYPSLLNHVKKHQKLNAGDYTRSVLKNKAKEVERKILEEQFESQHIQDAIMNKGMERLEKGEIKVTADHMLRAAKDKQDAQAKKRDQQLQLAEMVAYFASGEDKQQSERIHGNRSSHIRIEDYDPAIPVTENPDLRA